VRIDGEDYWDGGYAGNPVLFPFAYHSDARDIIIIQINPLNCRETPTDARGILDRVNEITFNASLLNELRAIDFVGRLLDEESLDPDRYKRIFVHLISDQEGLGSLGASSKMNAEWPFITYLHDLGQRAAKAWLVEHFDDIGRVSTLAIRSILHGCSR
jgi:NTE family protein